MLVVLVWVLAYAPATMAVDPSPTPVPAPVPTITVVVAAPNPVTFQSPVTLTAMVTPNPGAGTITWTDASYPDLAVGVSTIDAGSGMATLTFTPFAGAHAFQAAFGGSPGFAPSASAPLFVPVVSGGTLTVTPLAPSTPTAEEHAPVTLTATVVPAFEGIMLFVDGAAVLGNATIDPNTGTASLKIGLVGVGTHQITALALGDGVSAGSVSAPVIVTVTPDVQVLASAIGLSASAFYPYKDGYRDTVAIRGTPGEALSVTVRVYNSAGKRVRLWSLASRTSAWSIAWNGRTASGSLLAAGKYRIVQTLRDPLGHTRSFTAYTTISNKRLYWYTGSITKYGAQYSLSDYSTFAWVEPSRRYDRGVDIYGNLYDAWAWVGYNFVLPSAAKYGTLTFKVLGTPWSGYGVPYISFWNFANGEEDGERWVSRSYAWYGTSVSGTGHVTSSRGVRAYVTIEGSNRGWYDVAKVQLAYRYALLR